MNEIVWEASHSVEVNVDARFAWNFWTDYGRGLRNWNDPPAEFSLDGPFADGSRGTTRMPESPPMHWRIRDCRPPQTATVEMELDAATLSFEWRFENAGPNRARLTQHIVLRGTDAANYTEQLESSLRPNLATGMARIARLMEAASTATEPA